MDCESVVCDVNHLYEAYLASVKSSKWKESTQSFMLHFLRYLFQLKEDLINRTYKNSPSVNFDIFERGHLRSIASIPPRDRIVRHVLCDDIFMPEIRKRVIYDNGASLKGRGIDFQRRRFEVHLRRYYKQYGNEGWILFGDFSKFYDNIIHEIAKKQLLDLVDDDGFVSWLLDIIFKAFEIDASNLTDDEINSIFFGVFDKNKFNASGKVSTDGKRYIQKSVNIGDQLSQLIGIYYPNRIDTYVKYVRSQKYYGRYMDDWYVMSPSKETLKDILSEIINIANSLGIHINHKKTRIVKISSRFKFLQIRCTLATNGKIIKRINPKRVTAMRRKLKKLAAKVNAGEISYLETVENMFKGWMGSYRKLLSNQQKRNMVKLFETLFCKSVKIVCKKMVISDELVMEAA